MKQLKNRFLWPGSFPKAANHATSWGGPPGPRGSPWTRSLPTKLASSKTQQADEGVGRGPGVRPISVNLRIDFGRWVRLCWDMASQQENMAVENWAILRAFLPEGWK